MSGHVFAQNNCEIGRIRFEQSVCNDEGQFYVHLNFERANTSASFQVLGNGKNYGTFHYSDLPVQIGPLKADCTTQYEFVVKDNEFGNCQNFVEMGTKCCTTHCGIYVDSISSVCDNATMAMEVHVSRPSKNEGKYKLKINNVLVGTYDLGAPANVPGIEIDPLEPVMQIVACLVDTESCCDTFEYINPCFCSVTQFKAQILECDPIDSTFSIKLNFTGTMVGDSFTIGGNNTNYGNYAYSQLPITISDLSFSSNTHYEFLVVDHSSSFCFGAYELGIVENCEFSCSITHPTVEVLPCEDNGNFYVRLQFEDNNTSHSGFSVRGSGLNHGNFEYGEHYYDIGPIPGDCVKLYEFVIRDLEKEACSATIHLEEPVCCQEECYIREVNIEENCIDGQLVSFTINFDHNQDSTKIFGLWANGEKLGNYHFGSLPLTLTNIVFNTSQVVFNIVNLSNDNCRKEFPYTFECLHNGGNCALHIVNQERSECNADGVFYIFFSVTATNPGNDGFKVVGLHSNYQTTFPYGQARYKIGPFLGDCITKYTFLVQDINKPDCAVQMGLEGPVCCTDCFIREVAIHENCEENKLKSYTINFDHNMDSSAMFRLWANNIVVGTYSVSQLPVTISNINFTTQTVVFKIVNITNEACRKEATYTFECQVGDNNNPCMLDVTGFEKGECNDQGEFYVFFTLRAENRGNQGFSVFVNNSISAHTFEYGQTVYKIGPFKGDCITKYQFLIKDVAHPDCKTDFGLAEPVCCSEGCNIDNIHIVSHECVEGKVNIVVDFNHLNNSGSFILKLNGVVRGQYQYIDLPIVLRQLTPKETYKILIQDAEKDCVEDFTFMTPECTSANDDIFWKEVKVFATGEQISISLPQIPQAGLKAQLLDVLGRQLAQQPLYSKESAFQMRGNTTGVYFIHLQSGQYNQMYKVYWQP